MTTNLYARKEECCGCGACADICHTGALRMVWDEEGFQYPEVEEALCVRCGQCKTVCPIKNQEETNREPLYFGVQAKDDATRYSSTSGGMFSLLAQYILRQDGVVYGAAYSTEMEVVHREIRTREQLETIKKTKYVQSNLSGIYRNIQQQLEQNQQVLFCGTPCQTQALKLFLNDQYSKLTLVDLICYGVPSPGIWNSYVKYLEHKHGGKMTNFSFRDKRGKNNGQMRSYTIGKDDFVNQLSQDLYSKLYFGNYILRPSCHTCKFCTVKRGSDFTIGDFWGIERVRPDMEDGMGNSLVLVHTEKARKIWEAIKEDALWFPCKKEDVLQPRLCGPTKVAKHRRLFMAAYKGLPFPLLIKLITDWSKGLGKWRRIKEQRFNDFGGSRRETD